MDYMTAVRQAAARIEAADVDDEVEAQAVLRLACLAFDGPAPPDRAWALLGLELLTVLADLYPDPAPATVTVTAAPPRLVSAALRAALADLVGALAAVYERASAHASLPGPRRFAYAAAASRLHTAARAMT